MAFGAKIENFRENAFPTVIYLANAQNLRRIKQRKGLRFIQAISADKDDEMIFSYADFCIGLLAVPNNREFYSEK